MDLELKKMDLRILYKALDEDELRYFNEDLLNEIFESIDKYFDAASAYQYGQVEVIRKEKLT